MSQRTYKLLVPGARPFPDLSESLPVPASDEPHEHCIPELYLDTDDLRLARWGCSLKYRDADGWIVGLPVTMNGAPPREETFEFAGDRAAVPDAVANLLTPLTRSRTLIQVAQVSTKRRCRDWRNAAGDTVAAVSEDVVSAKTPVGPESSFRELQIKLGPGPDAAGLNAAVEALEANGDAVATAVPRAIRVLGERAVAPADVVVPLLPGAPSAAQIMQAAIANSVVRLLLTLPRIWVDRDAEVVHRARVATRRLRSDLRTFGKLLDKRWAADLRQHLSWLADELGRVRDSDVLEAKLVALAASHPEIEAGDVGAILRVLDDQRETARGALMRHLADDRAVHLYDELVAAANALHTDPRASQPATDVMFALARKPWRRLRRAVRGLSSNPAPEALHEVRIMAKRVRYATEAIAAITGRKARKFAAAATAVQDALGELNDVSVATAWLDTTAERLGPAAAFSAGRLAQQLRCDRQDHYRDWRKAYRRMEKYRGWLS